MFLLTILNTTTFYIFLNEIIVFAICFGMLKETLSFKADFFKTLALFLQARLSAQVPPVQAPNFATSNNFIYRLDCSEIILFRHLFHKSCRRYYQFLQILRLLELLNQPKSFRYIESKPCKPPW